MPFINKLLLISFSLFTLFTSTLSAEPYERAGKNELAFYSYKPTYFGISPYHNDSNNTGESKFQFSFKYEVFHESAWFLAYTQKTLWSTQASSGPVKETNYAPEVFYALDLESDVVPYIQFGVYKHESNGEAGTTSLQWNINYIEPVFIYEEYTLRVAIWVPLFFQSKGSASEDNAELFDYYGSGEVELFYHPENGDQHSLLYREGSINSVYALQYQWDVNINNFIEGMGEEGWNTSLFLQVFNGYGETLNTYNVSTTRVLVGLSISR